METFSRLPVSGFGISRGDYMALRVLIGPEAIPVLITVKTVGLTVMRRRKPIPDGHFAILSNVD